MKAIMSCPLIEAYGTT